MQNAMGRDCTEVLAWGRLEPAITVHRGVETEEADSVQAKVAKKAHGSEWTVCTQETRRK